VLVLSSSGANHHQAEDQKQLVCARIGLAKLIDQSIRVEEMLPCSNPSAHGHEILLNLAGEQDDLRPPHHR
jgi:hypothetical protein